MTARDYTPTPRRSPFAIKVLQYRRSTRPHILKNRKRCLFDEKTTPRSFLRCPVLMGVSGPLPAASAQGWWWHPKAAGPAGAGSDKARKAKAHREKHQLEKRKPLHKTPETVGWWHTRSRPRWRRCQITTFLSAVLLSLPAAGRRSPRSEGSLFILYSPRETPTQTRASKRPCPQKGPTPCPTNCNPCVPIFSRSSPAKTPTRHSTPPSKIFQPTSAANVPKTLPIRPGSS